MRFFILLSIICLSSELDSNEDQLVFTDKNHYQSLSQNGNALEVTQLDTEWQKFKLKFNRNYSPEEEVLRKAYFKRTLQFIESHNKLYRSGDVSHDVEINQFADWSPEEYNSMLSSTPVHLNYNVIIEEPRSVDNLSLPISFDWRQHGKVTPVKNQGSCGSCWAFTTIATIESAFLIKHNKTLNLSEQQLVDCCNKNNKHLCWGCGGGLIQESFKYVVSAGVENSADYKYMERDQKCADRVDRPHTKISGFKGLAHPSTDEDIMRAIYSNGPVGVYITADGDDFRLYRTGIMKVKETHTADHYVTAVGWGADYWIIKNSWGTHWGEQGFGLMARGVNLRGFNNYVFYPIV